MRDKSFWLALAFIGAVVWLISRELIGGELTQGSGAYDLISGAIKSRTNGAPGVPEVSFGTPSFYPAFYFVATATDDTGLVSDYSNEVAYQYTKERPYRIVTLRWDISPSTNTITNYSIHWSRDKSGVYTNTIDCGTNTIKTVRVLPELKTNVVITITARNATTLAYTDRPGNEWNVLGDTTWITTNPIGFRLWRAIGPKNPSLKIDTRWVP